MASALVRSSVWSKAKAIPAEYPFTFGMVLSGFKTSFSDLLVQKVVERRQEVDWKRNLAFTTFGFCYLGGVQYALYVPIFGRIFPNAAKFSAKSLREKLKDGRGMLNVAAQTILDQCVHHPFMYFPVFYCTKELVTSGGNPNFTEAINKYRENMADDLKALWKLWVPCTVVNFAFMPMHLRIPFAAGVSFLWTCILSAMRGGDAINDDDLIGGAITGASYALVKEGLDEIFNTTPLEMDDVNRMHFNISAAGIQKPGLVALLSRLLADAGGNVTKSKMVRLGNEFIIQLHVSILPENHKALLIALKSKELVKNLDIQATVLNRRDYGENKGQHKKSVMGMKIHCVGADK